MRERGTDLSQQCNLFIKAMVTQIGSRIRWWQACDYLTVVIISNPMTVKSTFELKLTLSRLKQKTVRLYLINTSLMHPPPLPGKNPETKKGNPHFNTQGRLNFHGYSMLLILVQITETTSAVKCRCIHPKPSP